MEKSPAWLRNTPVTIVGLGAVGGSLAISLKRLGCKPITGVGHNPSGDRRRARALKIRHVFSFEELTHKGGYIIISVQDSSIKGVVHQLMSQNLPWPQMTVLHTSGVSGPELFKSLARKGAGVAAWHPYQTFPSGLNKVSLKGVTFGITGNRKGEEAAAKLTRALGGKPVRIPARDRALYHASAVFACGFVAAKLDASITLLKKCGLTEKQAQNAALTIARQTLDNIEQLGTRKALTGPAVRGDVKTMKKHLAALKASNPELARVYAENSKQSKRQ